jgi:hypothetical protein
MNGLKKWPRRDSCRDGCNVEERGTMKSILSDGRCWRSIGTACAVMVMLTGIGARADADDVPNVDLKVERVALFKNGLGYFTSFTTLPKGATTIEINQLPVPSHGTFWVGYPKDVKVTKLVTSRGKKDVEGTTTARSITDLLQINSGREVTVRTGLNDMPAITGTIVQVMPVNQPTPSQSPNSIDFRSSVDINRNPSIQTTSLVIIKMENGNVALNVGSITRVDFDGDDITISVPNVSTTMTPPSIRIELENAAKGQEIGISYLARGITWAPSYLIDLSDSTTARLSAKAVVINEVADLQGIHLDLVTGFPNIQYGEVNSPVSMSENLAGFLRALATGRSGSSRSGSSGGVLGQMSAVYVRGGRAGEVDQLTRMPAPDYSTAQEGAASEDLFLYPIESFTLLRGETATIPLFTAAVSYKHVYTWVIPDILDEDEYYRQEPDSADVVWHSCRLENGMEMPWTTAVTEFVKDGQFTGQDICYYTAPGTETTVRINRALNILTDRAEFELERQRKVEDFYGRWNDPVKVKGELELRNRFDKSIVVEVTKNLSGEVLESVPAARDIPTAKRLQRVNPRHLLLWDVELKPGQKQTLSYTYEVYIRI